MMKKLKTTIIFICCGLGYDSYAQMPKASWLIGPWENKTPKGSIYESWISISDTELQGKSYIIKDKDTIIFETIQMIQEKEHLVYIPTVKNQNKGLPVRFTSTLITADRIIFENKEHDFPQIISYTKDSSDGLVAEISGTKNGNERKQTFVMKRLK